MKDREQIESAIFDLESEIDRLFELDRSKGYIDHGVTLIETSELRNRLVALQWVLGEISAGILE